MKKYLLPRCLILALLCALVSSCGYSARALLPSRFKTVHIAPFKNKISYTSDEARETYFPLLEIKIRNAVADRFLFDGNLKVDNSEQADLLLKGELIGYQRDGLRYTENEDVQEYRIRIEVSLQLWDSEKNELLWEEPSFSADTTYFLTGPLAKSETTAVEDALKDLARRVVERTIEDW